MPLTSKGQRPAQFSSLYLERRVANVTRHSGYRVFKRLIHMVLLSVAAVIGIITTMTYQDLQQARLSQETAQPGESLARQYSLLLSPIMESNDKAALALMLTTLSSEPLVIDASVYDNRGILLGDTKKIGSILDLYATDAPPPVTHVSDILNASGQPVGYLRLLVNTQALLSGPQMLEQQRQHILWGASLLTLIIGSYLTRGFYKFRQELRERRQSGEKQA